MYAQPVPASVHTSTGCQTKKWVIGTADVVLTVQQAAASAAPDARQAAADKRKDHTLRPGRDFESLIFSLPFRRA